MVNPFYSERTKHEIALRASRPKGLPEQTPMWRRFLVNLVQELALGKAVEGKHRGSC